MKDAAVNQLNSNTKPVAVRSDGMVFNLSFFVYIVLGKTPIA